MTRLPTALPRIAALLCWLAAAAFLLAAPGYAQQGSDAPVRDPEALAYRLLGWDGALLPPAFPALYTPGDTASFQIARLGSDLPVSVTATLAAMTPDIAVWVEDGISYSPVNAQQLAQLLDQIVAILRSRGTYRPATEQPVTRGQVVDPFNMYPLPDVGGETRLDILFAADLPDDRDTIVNPIDRLPPPLQPAGYGNARNLIVVNTSPYIGAALNNEVFINAIVRAVFNLIFDTSYDVQPAWLREALGWYLLMRLQQASVGAAQAADYLLAPQTALLRPSSLTTRAQSIAAQLLFMSYLRQRYGERVILRLYSSEGEGVLPLDSVFAELGTTDPLSGATVTADEAFADFVMANGLNGAFGDGRYVHRVAQLERGQAATAVQFDRLPGGLTGRIGPYGTHYYEYQASSAITFELALESSQTVPRLNLSNSADSANRFYWSGRVPNRNHTLTRAFDLSGVDAATLTYDIWHDLADGWNYGYVEVSTDAGETWQVLPARHTTGRNRYGAAYGPGYTGISNPDGPRPFPIIGIQIADDGMSIVSVEPDSPAKAAGLLADDVIIGYDRALWPSSPNVLGLLARYSPGDTLNFWIQRGPQRLEVPVVLGASPTRVVQPEPRWLQETIDLSVFAGQQIMVRFEYVSLPGRWNEGYAVDNIAIPEIDYLDDAEGDSDWVRTGWEVVDNQLEARWLIQVATFGAQGQPPRVRRLLDPDDTPAGAWRVSLAAGERMLLAVAAMQTGTLQDSSYELRVRAAS